MSPQGTRARDLAPVAATVLFGFCCAYAAYAHATAGVLPYDDSFITFRYVANLFKGHGLVYNPGQRVFGSSTPLYLAWLAALKALLSSVEIPTLAVRGNVLFFLATAFGFVFLLRKLLGWTTAGAVAAGLFLLRYDMLAISLGGNETFLFCALAVWSFYLVMEKRYAAAGALAGLSVMARPEGVFCALLVGLVWLLYDRKKPVAFGACILAPGLLWTVFAFAYYGTPVYHSLIAKSRPLYPFPPGFALRYILDRLTLWTAGPRGSVYELAVVLVGASAGFIFARRTHRTTWFVIPAFTGLILLFYGVSNPYIFEWYFPILFLGWFPLVMTGLAYLVMEAAEALRARYRIAERRLLVSTLCAAIPLLLLATSTAATWKLRHAKTLPGYFASFHAQFRTLAYREAAEFINRMAGPSDTVATPEVGALGFYLNRHVYDSGGLVTPEAIPFLPMPYGKRVGPNIASVSADFARAVDADWIVTMEIFAVEDLIESPWFRENYVLVKKFPLRVEAFHSRNVVVYRHK